ncbi:bacterial Ig-like domain-containing protein [Olsenella profusa]|uniref:Bacterial Ig-like domain-containing protein n=2 Tax=Olsenella profusa TaxID=138595 RepID=A0ABS2F1S0_9ACTN|nr:bacterial Ig-like domain-containing protein [Olsenella profusa]
MKNRGVGGVLCLVAGLVALVTAVVFFATQAEAAPLGHTGIMPGVALLAGVVVTVALTLVPLRFGALIQTVVYGVAVYFSVTQLYLVFADVIFSVTYAGGNALLCVMYMAGALLSCVLCVVACFFEKPVSQKDRQGSKKLVPVAAVLVVAAVVGVFAANLSLGPGAATSSDSASGSEEAATGATMKYADNEFKDMSIDELAAIPRSDWEAKEANGDVAYFFEGQYTEGFATVVDPACLDMYLCTDGSMYGSLSGPVTSVAPGVTYVYGYWYNVDESGENNFVIHLAGTQSADGTTRATSTEGGEDADIQIFDTDHGDYNWEASFSLGLYGGAMTRNMNIYGQVYAPAQSLEIDASQLDTFYTGDTFNPAALSVTVVRASGATENIWGGRLSFSGYDSETTGTKTVTGSFLGATATFDVTVDELNAETYAGTYGLVTGDAVVDTDVTMTVDYSHKTVTIASADGSAKVVGTISDATDTAVTMSINGSEPLTATISGSGDAKTITVPAHQEVVNGMTGSTTYDVGEYTLTLSK